MTPGTLESGQLDPCGAARAPQRPLLARHVAVFVAALGGFIDLYCTQAIYPALQERFAISVAGAGALVTTTTLVLAGFAPYAGVISGWAGARRATLAGLLGLSLCTLLMAFATDGEQLITLRVLQGLCIPVVLASMLASNQAEGDTQVALALSGTYVSGTVIGGVLGRLVPAALMPLLEWQGAFVVFALLHIGLLAVVAWLYRPPQAAEGPLKNTGWSALRAMPKQRVTLLGLGGFALMFGQAATFTYIAIRFASAPYEWSPLALGALYAVFIPSLIFLRASRGLVDRIGPLAALKRSAAALWVGLLFTLAAAPAVVVVGLTVFAVGVFLCQAILAYLVSAAAKQDGAPVAGIYLCCYYLGASAGAVAPAVIWGGLGWPGCVAFIAAVQLAGVVGARYLRPSHHVAPEAPL